MGSGDVLGWRKGEVGGGAGMGEGVADVAVGDVAEGADRPGTGTAVDGPSTGDETEVGYVEAAVGLAVAGGLNRALSMSKELGIHDQSQGVQSDVPVPGPAWRQLCD